MNYNKLKKSELLVIIEVMINDALLDASHIDSLMRERDRALDDLKLAKDLIRALNSKVDSLQFVSDSFERSFDEQLKLARDNAEAVEGKVRDKIWKGICDIVGAPYETEDRG